MRRLSLSLAFLALCSASAFAQSPYLVKDLGNAGSTTPQSSAPAAFLSSGGTLFFTAATETNGREPWVHDANGTRLLRDIKSGAADSGIARFAEITPGVVVFAADDGVNGLQLWRSDGTEAGTTLVKVVSVTTSTFAVASSYGGKVYFFADNGTHGREPWVTDGTAAGTVLLADTRGGSAGNTTWQIFRFGNTMRIFSWGGIWKTDGTPAGTTLEVPLASFRLPAAITSNAIYFFGFDANYGFEPWKSDGTSGGTAMIKDIRSGTASSIITASTAPTATGAVFFADDGSGQGGQLWTTDGSAANTVRINAYSGLNAGYSYQIFYLTSRGAFFTKGSDIWRTDGTEAGTYVASSLTSGNGPAFNFVDAFSKVYFQVWIGSQLRLYQFDGTQGATPAAVRTDVEARDMAFTGGKIWFAGTDAANGSEVWVSDDGTTAGTHLAANVALDPARSSNPQELVADGARLYFHLAREDELWRSDGTNGGTFELTDFNNPYSGGIDWITPYGGDVYFKQTHFKLHRVNTTTGATTHVGDFDFDGMRADSNYIYMWSSWFNGKVWRSNGTAAGTIRLYDPVEPLEISWYYPSVLLSGGSAWIFTGRAMYRTEGTLETTRRLLSIPEGWSFGYPQVAAGGVFYASVHSSSTGYELWRTDGTPAGSGIVKDIVPGSGSSSPGSLTAAGRLLFFTASTADHGTELWRTDGTEAGTFLLKDIRPGTSGSNPSAFAAVGGILYFAATDGTNGYELWKSDGTAAGTALVRDIAPGSFSSNPLNLTAAGGRLWFTANDGLHGVELWSSDGTEAGTVMAGDIVPGSSASSPERLTPAESQMFFTATTDVEGRELWAVQLTGGYVSITGERKAEGNSGTRALRFTITRHGSSSGTASVAWATSPGTATAGTDYDSANGTIQFGDGETVKTVDVTIHGDTDLETNETVFVQLSAPSGVAIQTATAAGVIDDDDPRADLSVEIVQLSYPTTDAPRRIKVTNHGPSSARAVTVTFTDSPFEFAIYSGTDIKCATTTMPTQCTIPFLTAGESRTFDLQRWPVKGFADPALPPGSTVTVSVAAALMDPNPANDITTRMTTNNGMLLMPSKLIIGTPATVTFDLGDNAASATDVTLTSAAVNVTVSPATATIAAGQRTATFTLTVSAGAGKTLLTAKIGAETKAALVAPVVASGQAPMLDVAVFADNKSTYAYDELFVIPVRIAAVMHDGTRPAGLVSLLDQNDNTIAQLALDTEGKAYFTRPQPVPGEYRYRVRYHGDTHFNPLTAALPAITVQKATPSLYVYGPALSCSNTVELRLLVKGPSGAPAPTGTVSLTVFPNSLGTWPIAPNGIPGESEVTVTLNFTNGYKGINASYSGDGYYAGASGRKDLGVGCSAMNFVATATSPTSVAFSWTQPAGTTNRYEVYRARSIQGPFQWVVSTTVLHAVDTTAQPGHVYVYYVGAYGNFGTPSYNSGIDIASTFNWSDNPLTAGMLIKSIHLAQLRSMVAALRIAAGLPALTFTGSVAAGNAMDARHITELRTSIDASRARLGLPPFTWVQPNAATGALIRAATVQELRGVAN